MTIPAVRRGRLEVAKRAIALLDPDNAAAMPLPHLGSTPRTSGDDRTRPAPRPLREYLDRPELLQPPSATVPGLAYPGRTVLAAGREKSGKTTLMTQAASALSTGGEFLGAQLGPGRTLIYQLDEAIGDTVRRLAQLGADPDLITIQTERPNPEELRSEIEATGADWAIVDCLSEVFRGQIRSSRDEDEVAR